MHTAVRRYGVLKIARLPSSRSSVCNWRTVSHQQCLPIFAWNDSDERSCSLRGAITTFQRANHDILISGDVVQVQYCSNETEKRLCHASTTQHVHKGNQRQTVDIPLPAFPGSVRNGACPHRDPILFDGTTASEASSSVDTPVVTSSVLEI